jgi:TRAP-type mannitol/chloroaromatic compound transport system permease large subunit
MLFGIFVGATAFSYVFRALGGEHLIVEFIKEASVGPWSILLVLMLMIFALGFFFDWIEITLIVLPIFAPIVALLDFGGHIGEWEGVAKPAIIWFLILAAVNLQTSFLTPPFGFALFYLKGVAPPSVKIQQIYRGIIPFVLLQVFGLMLCIAFPQLVLWLPSWALG